MKLSLALFSLLATHTALAAPLNMTAENLVAVLANANFQKHFAKHIQIATIHVGMFPTDSHSIDVVSYDERGNHCRTSISPIEVDAQGRIARIAPEAFHASCKE